MAADHTLAAAACAGLAVTCATVVVAEFFGYASALYRQRYLRAAAVELDDVLLEMPPARIFDLSLALSGLAGFAAALLLGMSGGGSWMKAGFAGVAAAALAFPVPRLVLRFLRQRRLRMFDEQLEDALTGMSSALKAGFSISQALETVAEENRHPISIEFRLLVQELRLGVSLEDALENMCRRLGSADFELVATAIVTARQTGGELTAVFDRLSAMIRERLRIEGRLRALTAQGRLQAYVIGAMPFLLMLAMNYVAPAMMAAFFHSALGMILIAAVLLMVVAGFLVIKKITTIDV
jgi:tight adherence protein B